MPDARPNIILIITDQQRYDTIKSLGFPYMDTPNLDRLVREGVALTNCFISAPSCVPSRASLFTGYFPHTTGVLQNGDVWRHSWVETLAASGYYCVNIGKMHTVPHETPLGFHERYVVENKDRFLDRRWYFDEWDKALHARGLVKQQRELYRKRPDYRERLGTFEWELPEDMHSDMFVGGMAEWWISSKPKLDQPVFLQIGFPGPHPPYDPIARYAEPYLTRDLPLPSVSADELNQEPPPLLQMRQHNADVDHDSVVHLLNPTREQLQRQRAYYLANVTMIDEKIGAILAALQQKGYLENAVVIFTSDHGDALGDHGHSQKWTMYDIITRAPTIVWAPGGLGGGRTADGLVAQGDLGPTILELAGVRIPPSFEFRSLVPLLRGEEWREQEYVFAEHGRDGTLQGVDFVSMVRSREWKLVHFLDQPWGQLFDLAHDAGEVHNLWHDPAHEAKKQALLDVLRDWRIRSQYQTRQWTREWR